MGMKLNRKKAKQNIRKAQAAWRAMSHRRRAKAQPEGRKRAKPGTKEGGDFFHVVVRPKEEFRAFRTQDVGKRGHIERVAGKRSTGSWDTVKWLIGKHDAHIEGRKLIADTGEARKVLNALGSKPIHVRGDVFKAKPRPDIPEWAKPTLAQRVARRANIKKAQAVRHARAA